MPFSIRFSPEEKALVESYAKLHSTTVGDALKDALFSQIADEYDITIAEAAYGDYLNRGQKSRPATELWKEMEL